MPTSSQKQKAIKKEAQDWVTRALGTFIACQKRSLPAPAFPMSDHGFILTIMAGYDDDTISTCKKFVEEGQVILVAHEIEQNRKDRANEVHEKRASGNESLVPNGVH